MRRSACAWLFVSTLGAWPRSAAAEGSTCSPCVDAEPAWFSASAGNGRFAWTADTSSPNPGKLAVGGSVGFRYRPAILTAPSPSQSGRDINVLRWALDLTLGARIGMGKGLELTVVAPAGLVQRGAGIKGVTHQAADPIAPMSLHDPRLGFGFLLPHSSPHFAAKLRFEAKLPLGDEAALAGEQSVVASPSLAFSTRFSGFAAGLELGARLRRPSDLFGARIGSQGLVAGGLGYEFERPRLRFSVEAYALPSLVRSGAVRYLPAEWLASTAYSPSSLPAWSFGLGGGSGLPFSGSAADSTFAFGVPALRTLVFVGFAPRAD